MVKNIAVIGSSGALGNAFIEKLSEDYPESALHAFSHNTPKKILPKVIYHKINYQEESSIAESALIASKNNLLDIVIVATGILHDNDIMPEKSLNELSAHKFRYLFEINTIIPAIIAKYFSNKLRKDSYSIFATLSARIGSISDNKIGGWYSYRASKAALNMIIKNTAIEIARNNKNAIIVGLHPGTVDSKLSKPFQANIPDGKLFTPKFSVDSLIKVLKNLTPQNSGRCFAWDGKEIMP